MNVLCVLIFHTQNLLLHVNSFICFSGLLTKQIIYCTVIGADLSSLELLLMSLAGISSKPLEAAVAHETMCSSHSSVSIRVFFWKNPH